MRCGYVLDCVAGFKQGRYVRIQLLDKNYLSLAEVQVMGVLGKNWILLIIPIYEKVSTMNIKLKKR
jgi:hypothetical protein